MIEMKTQYEVEVLRSGQPRAYADTEREYLITVKQSRKAGFVPWVMLEDVEAQIAREERARAEGKMAGGFTPEMLRKTQREWALKLVRALCQNFREKGDEDGRTGMDAHFYPTLKTLTIDHKAGTVRAFIIEPYTD